MKPLRRWAVSAVTRRGAGRETGHDQQPARGEVGLPGGRSLESGQTAGGAYHNWGLATQQDRQTFLFNRGVKAADDGSAFVAPPCGAVGGRDDQFPRTLGGAKQAGELLVQERLTAQELEDGRYPAGDSAEQAGGIIGRAGVDAGWGHLLACSSLRPKTLFARRFIPCLGSP